MKKLIIFLLFFSFYINSSAQNNINKGFNNFTKSKRGLSLTKELLISEFRSTGVLESSDSLVTLTSKLDKYGINHIKTQQYHLGIPIENAYYSFHIKNENLLASNGEIKTITTSTNVPSISKESILEVALNKIQAKKYLWEDNLLVEKIKANKTNRNIEPKATLVYFQDKELYKLCYKIEIHALIPQGRYILYLDSNSGEILKKIDITAHTTGSCSTVYHGTQDIEFDEPSAGNYTLTDQTRNMETYVLPNNSINYSQAQIPTSTFQDWNDINSQDALDVHWSTQVTYDFLGLNGIQSYDNENAQLISYVNYGDTNASKNNAFWNGSFLTYGAGGSSVFPGPVATLDVVAHEIGHAVTENYGNGLQYYGESGALNESYSDIIAASVENFVNTSSSYNGLNVNEWLISDLNGSGIRDLSNPNTNNKPDTYNGQFWASTTGADNGGVHTNSSVGNFWFYLLANGGSGTNDNGFNYNITGVGFDTALTVALEAYNYLNYTSNYQDWRDATIFYASLNYNCAVVQQIIDAWNAVDVGTINESCSLIAKIDSVNVTQYCTNSPTTFTAISGANATSTWSIDDVSQTSNVLTFTSEGFHKIKLTNTYSTGEIATDEIEVYATECNPSLLSNKNTWYFYDNLGLDFSSGIAENISYPHTTWRSNIMYSDNQGDLKFYMSPIGLNDSTGPMHIIDPDTHDSITELTPISDIQQQIGVSIPNPQNNLVNVFIANGVLAGSGFYRTIIDVSVQPATVSQSLSPVTFPSNGFSYHTDGSIKLGQCLTAIPSCSENIYWIIAKAISPSEGILIYKLDYSTNPIGDLVYINNFSDPTFGANNQSPIIVSPNGNYFVTNKKLFGFDRETGQITLLFNDELFSYYGTFSPNSRFFYCDYDKYTIQQFDLWSNNIENSVVRFTTGSTPFNISIIASQMDFKLGPDNKIYVSYRKRIQNPALVRPHIGVINKPNKKQINNAIEFNSNAYIYFSSNFPAGVVFPSFIETTDTSITPLYFNFGTNNCNSYYFKAPSCKPFYSWDFGDGTTSTVQNPTHVFSSAGTYIVSLTSNNQDNTQTITETITIDVLDTTNLEILAPDSVCEYNTIAIAPTGFINYVWSLPNGGGTINSQNGLEANITWDSLGSKVINLTITDSNGCTAMLSHTLTVLNEDCDYNLSVDEFEVLENVIYAYPNPTQDFIHVGSKGSVLIEKVEVFSVTGSRILFKKGKQFKLDISKFSNNVYFLRIITNKGVVTKKVIKL